MEPLLTLLVAIACTGDCSVCTYGCSVPTLYEASTWPSWIGRVAQEESITEKVRTPYGVYEFDSMRGWLRLQQRDVYKKPVSYMPVEVPMPRDWPSWIGMPQ